MDAAAKWMADHGVPSPARGFCNTGEQVMLVMPEHACGVYMGFVGPCVEARGSVEPNIDLRAVGFTDGLDGFFTDA